ncbi:MAG: molecular chaperone TorD family protein [Burkholderiaceae bacterium]|nr:molecular chaperone TorD family protein [Burkholderiaceae bacterium]MEB2349884.1 molecular chaperone TorD family protein [Burkholderiaceae bacterium]
MSASTPGTAPIAVDLAAVAPEDAARARWYGLFASLFRAPPTAEWLAAIAASAGRADCADDDRPLGRAWSNFAGACAQADAGAVREEFDTAFLGVGKADVIPYASYHLSGFLNDRPLIELRGHLAQLGLARRADIGETEDHLSALCETMAWLIAGDAGQVRDFATQRAFFSHFLAPWHDAFAETIERSGVTDFYKHAGRLLREFLAIERQGFEFDSA